MIGASGHYLAFRQDANGDWHQVDSASNNQVRMTPLEFMHGRFAIEREYPGLRHMAGPRFEFMTFDAEGPVNPIFGGSSGGGDPALTMQRV